MKTGDVVKLGQFKVEGKVLQILEDSVLVEHEIIRDGQSRVVNQWYSKDLVTGVIETEEVEIKVEVSVKPKKKKNRKKSKIEFGIIPDINK